ncbi:MAG: ATP-grasp domain-containing protein [Xanthomonadaceae bacterium]|nr:ATP-grasp domain-containing protein [Xanthomonadaceae bacterium]
MATVIVTGSRAPVALDFIRALKREGHRVIAVESANPFVAETSNCVDRVYHVPSPRFKRQEFVSSLIKIIRDEKVDLLVPTCEEIFHIGESLDELRPHVEVFCEPTEKLNLLHNKFKFTKTCEEMGLTVPKSVVITSLSELNQALASIPGDRIVLKPEYSRFAAKTLVIAKSDIGEHLKDITPSQTQKWVVQQCVVGHEVCSYSVAFKGKVLASVIYHHEFTAGQGAGVSFETIRFKAIDQWITTLSEKMNFTGQLAFDFIIDDSGIPYAIECNPRMTSGAHLLSETKSFIDSIITKTATPSPFECAPVGYAAALKIPLLIHGLMKMKSLKQFFYWLRLMIFSKDAVFSARDVRPTLTQFTMYWKFYKLSRERKIKDSEAITFDIEWNGNSA